MRQTGLPLRLLEIGASAGLNLRWDHFPFLDVPATIRVAERRGCDLNPIDPTLDESRAALLCFVWPDQTERLQVLAEVIDSLDTQHPGFKSQITDEGGALHRFINLYRNGEDIRYLSQLGTPVSDGDVIAILPAVAGG